MSSQRRIYLQDGIIGTIDEADFEAIHTVEFTQGLLWTGRICDMAWRAKVKPHTQYVVCSLSSTIELRLHRVVMNAKQNQLIDHIDRNGLNNAKDNLRVASFVENSANRSKQSSETSSRYKGVSRQHNKFCAAIRISGRKRHLGMFATEIEAAAAYNAAALSAWGDKAVLNAIAS